MKLDDERESDNVEDRRGESGGGGFSLGAGHLSLGGIVLALVVSYFSGISPSTIMSLISGGSAPTSQTAPVHKPPANDAMATFVSKVLADTEDTWQVIFRESKRERVPAPHETLRIDAVERLRQPHGLLLGRQPGRLSARTVSRVCARPPGASLAAAHLAGRDLRCRRRGGPLRRAGGRRHRKPSALGRADRDVADCAWRTHLRGRRRSRLAVVEWDTARGRVLRAGRRSRDFFRLGR